MLARIAYTRSQIEAAELHSLLISSGFHAMPVDYSAHLTVAGAEHGYYLEVSRAEADRARELLEELGFTRLLVPADSRTNRGT